jgi:hypothetical protein
MKYSYTTGYLKEGFNFRQANQLGFLETMNDREIVRGLWSTSYAVSCDKCKENHRFGAAEVARKWVEKHKDHFTTVRLIKG